MCRRRRLWARLRHHLVGVGKSPGLQNCALDLLSVELKHKFLDSVRCVDEKELTLAFLSGQTVGMSPKNSFVVNFEAARIVSYRRCSSKCQHHCHARRSCLSRIVYPSRRVDSERNLSRCRSSWYWPTRFLQILEQVPFLEHLTCNSSLVAKSLQFFKIIGSLSLPTFCVYQKLFCFFVDRKVH